MSESEKHPCSVCDRTDLSLTVNGRIRSHAANGKRPGPDNPHCPGGSAFPKHEHAYNTPDPSPTFEDSPPLCDVCGEPDPRPTQKQVDNALFVGPIGEIDVPPEVEAEADDVMARARDHGIRPETKGSRDPSEGKTPVTSADSFLGGDAPEEERSANYFEARYDGDCDTCGRHFDAGDEIRSDGSGGWEGKDCCGDDLDEEAEQKPQSTAPQLPVRNGRYRGPDPETGKASAWTRTTTFAEAIADSFALNEWQLRMCVLGLVKRPDLMERVRSIVQAHGPDVPLHALAKLQRQVLNTITEDARLAAGSKERARKGTILHKHSQEIDMGRKGLGDVPEEFRPDATAYVTAMAANGLECIPDLIERSTCVPDYEVAGTFDRVLRVTRTLEPVTLDEGRQVQLHEGEFVIGDVKTGTDLSYAWLEILIQLAVYAMGVTTSGVAVPDRGPQGTPTWRWASLAEFGIDKLRTDVAIVMHVPYGEGRAQMKYADLITGTRGARICRQAIQYRKIKPSEAAIGEYTVIQKPKATFVAAGDQVKGKVVTPSTDTRELVKTAPVRSLTGTPEQIAAQRPAPKTAREIVQAAATTWEEVGALVKTRDEANDVWRKMKEKKIEPDRIARVVKIMKVALA